MCSQEIDLESTPLGLDTMAGTFVITGALMLMGLMWHISSKLHTRRDAQKKMPLHQEEVRSMTDTEFACQISVKEIVFQSFLRLSRYLFAGQFCHSDAGVYLALEYL